MTDSDFNPTTDDSKAESLVGDTDQAIAFLQLLRPGGPWVLSAIIPDGEIETRTFHDEQKAHAWIERYQGQGNLHYSLNPTKRSLNSKATKKDIASGEFVFADLDPREEETPQECKTRYQAALAAGGQKPYAIIDSGNGIQVLLRLAEPSTDFAAVEAASLAFTLALGGTRGTQNIDRILRLPGTINLPTKAKRDKGRIACRALLIEANAAFCQLDDLPKSEDEGGSRAEPQAKAAGEGKTWPRRDLPYWCRRLIAQGPDSEGRYSYGGDRSAAVFAVACTMVRCGYSDEEIADVLSDANNGISEKILEDRDPHGEALRQAKRAREKVKVERGQNDQSGQNAAATAVDLLRDPWPAKMDPAAFRGLAGEIVQAIEPHSEADPAALLVQLLVTFANCRGRVPYFQVESTRHYANLFAVLVGATAKARKGTSWGRIAALFLKIDLTWDSLRHPGSLSSGEGLIYQVRDETTKEETDRKTGDTQTVVVDPGVKDKRLLVQEEEFAAAMRVMRREGNTLSATIRSAWDHGNLRPMTKHSPMSATNAHISIVGHCTMEELKRHLGASLKC